MEVEKRMESMIGRITTIKFSSVKFSAIKAKAGYIEKIMKYQGKLLISCNVLDISFLSYKTPSSIPP